MKVGLITSEESFLSNYGAVLQGYALYTKLVSLGLDCEIIRYRGIYIGKRSDGFFDKIRYTLSEQLSIFDLVKYYVDRSARKRRQHLFEQFTKMFLKFNGDDIGNYEKFRLNPPYYDIYICGSDQIWNPKIKGNANDRGYFLDFAPIGKKRIAYAPSIGIGTIPSGCTEEMANLIRSIDHISIREESGAAIIKEITGLDVPILLDPTMLLDSDDWGEISLLPPNVKGDYILVYIFGNLKHTRDCINQLHKRFRLPVITLPCIPTALKGSYTRLYDVGPQQFLGLIKNARLICTDSFHATVFSIIFERPFYTFLRELPTNEGTTMNSRMEHLLNLCQLRNRLILPNQEIHLQTTEDIDFRTAKIHIRSKQTEANDFLNRALFG